MFVLICFLVRQIFKPSYQTGRLVCVCGMHSRGAADHGNSQCIFARSSSSLGRVPKQVLPGWWIQVPSIFLQHSFSRLWGWYIVSFSLFLPLYLSPLTQFLSLLLENQDSFCKVQSIKVPNLSPLNLCRFAFETGFCQISTYVDFPRILSPDLLLRAVFVCQISQCGFTKNQSSADFLLRVVFVCQISHAGFTKNPPPLKACFVVNWWETEFRILFSFAIIDLQASYICPYFILHAPCQLHGRSCMDCMLLREKNLELLQRICAFEREPRAPWIVLLTGTLELHESGTWALWIVLELHGMCLSSMDCSFDRNLSSMGCTWAPWIVLELHGLCFSAARFWDRTA